MTVTDGTARLTLTFFHRVYFHQKILRPGGRGPVRGHGLLVPGRAAAHPSRLRDAAGDERAGVAAEIAADYATELIPVYPASAKIASWQISGAVQTVLDTLDVGEDPLSPELRERYGLGGLAESIRAIHRPLDVDDYRAARERLKWDEAFVLQAALAQRRHAAAAMPATPRPREPGGLAEAFDARLPFRLTDGQQAAGETISADLACAYPMHRLLQGEVGSGKTVIAVRAMLEVVDAGGQAALLAPTEVLAQQHYRSISAMLGPLGPGGSARRGRARDPGGTAHRITRCRRAAFGAHRRVHRRRRYRDRHARAARGARPVLRPRADRHRRAAPVRRRAA